MSGAAAMKEETLPRRAKVRILAPEEAFRSAPQEAPAALGSFFGFLLLVSYFFSIAGLAFIVRGLFFLPGA